MTPSPREPAATDVAAIVALNEASVVETSPLSLEQLQSLLRIAFRTRVVGKPGQIDGFLIAFDQDAPYQSPNFQWFRAQLARFVYIDRVVIAAHARRTGLGGILYRDLLSAARRAGYNVVCCEVNVSPPNPASDAFHSALGFAETGRVTLESGKTVRYLVSAS